MPRPSLRTRLLVSALEQRVVPATFTVMNTNDSGSGSLRQAVLDANAAVGADSITFDAAAFASPQVIVLTSGQMAVTESTSIIGPGANLVTIDGNQASRIFKIDGAGVMTVGLSGLKLTGGLTTGTEEGGAIVFGNENVTLTNCVLTGNTAWEGGAIDSSGNYAKLTLDHCTITNNTANNSGTGDGGGVNIDAWGCTLVLTDCTVSGNSAASEGAGVYFLNERPDSMPVPFGGFVCSGVTVSNNTAVTGGGGIFLRGKVGNAGMSIRNSTISGNTSNSAGGIDVYMVNGLVSIQNCTITDNYAIAGNGGGIGAPMFIPSTPITLVSTIISANNATGVGLDIYSPSAAANTTLTDCLLGSQSGISNPIKNATTTSLLGQPPNLGPLADNGGPGKTHALLSNSPAIGLGSNPAPALTSDQRGRLRVYGTIDIGAFELQVASKVTAIVVGDGTNQRSMVNQIKVTFDAPVAVSGALASAFTLIRQSDNQAVALAATASGNDVTLTFTGGAVDGKSLADGRYTLTILASQFPAEGFDGDGNGIPGDDFTLIGDPTTASKLFRLYGDADGNGLVDGIDFGAFRSAFNTNNSIFDFDGSGVVDGLDFGQFRQRFGVTI